jgi:hypothetical protein
MDHPRVLSTNVQQQNPFPQLKAYTLLLGYTFAF